MEGWKRFLWMWVLVLLLASSFAQQSASKYGQGAGQGGSSGGGGTGGFTGSTGTTGTTGTTGAGGLARRGSMDNRANEDPWRPAQWNAWRGIKGVMTGSALTYRFQFKKGDVVLARCESESFNPRLALSTDLQLIAENADRAPGLQDPFMVAEIPADGEYIIQVLSQGQGAGQFELQYWVGRLVEVPLGAKFPAAKVDPDRAPFSNTIVAKFQFQKGQIYDLGIASGALIGPSATPTLDYEEIDESAYNVLRARQTGAYYWVTFNGQGAGSAGVERIEAKRGEASTPIQLGPGRAMVLEYPVKQQSVLRLGVPLYIWNQVQVWKRKRSSLNPGVTPESDSLEVGKIPIGQRNTDFLLTFPKEGLAEVLLRNISDKPINGRVQWADDVPVWQPGATNEGAINVGESRFYVVNAAKSDLMKVFVKASAFVPQLDIFDLQGDVLNSLVNRDRLTAQDDLFFPSAGMFVMRVTSLANAGSGSFQMKRDVPVATAVELGKTLTLKLDDSSFGLYGMTLKKGTRYEVRVQNDNTSTQVDLLTQDGEFLFSQKLSFGSTTMDYFVAESDGPARLWIRGGAGERKITVREFNP